VVFTSLPSATGEGYRVVAASCGVRAQERTEITRRSPSHGALCSVGADASGLAITTLASGRVCVSFSRFAGAEHTGRGGRVWTDALLVEAGDFLRAGGHPGVFARGVAAAPLAVAKLGPSIERLSLQVPAALALGLSLPAIAGGMSGAALVGLAAVVVVERSPCAVAVPCPVKFLEAALALVPAALRGELSVSAGLRFANSRPVTCCVVEQIDFEIRRATRGRPVALLVADQLIDWPSGRLGPWLGLMRRWWDEGRGAQAATLADSLRDGWPLPEILEVARLCEAIDRSEEKPEVLEALLASRAAA